MCTSISPHYHDHSGSSGNVSFTDLAPGKYVLRVAATNSREDRAIERRSFEISSDPSFCTTHLINGGVTVSGDIATVEFAGTGPAETFRCKLDTEPAFACKLKLTLHIMCTSVIHKDHFMVQAISCTAGEKAREIFSLPWKVVLSCILHHSFNVPA